MKHTIILFSTFILILACGGKTTESKSETTETKKDPLASIAKYDPNRGEGKWSSANVNVGASLDAPMAAEGEKVYSVKCSSCHKLTEERLVGPGWKGVTQRRTPEWIMNFITNPDPMITKDPVVQAQLELCLVRMPNQNLNDAEARSLLEYMRKNDGVN
jgi:mono/diheme cytochrome c family protein